jgi:hypothetical protein
MPGPYAQGTGESLVLGFENGVGVLPSPVIADKVPVTAPAIRPNRNKFTSNALTGSAEPRGVKFGKQNIGGSFGLECNPASLMPACRGLFGGWRTSGVAGLWAQEYFLGTQPPMFSRQAHSVIGQYLLRQGFYLGSTTWSFASEGIMEATFNVMGATEVIAAVDQVTGTITDRTGYDPFSYLLVRIKQGGAVLGYSTAVDVTIDRKLGIQNAQDQTNGPAVIFSAVAAITGKMTALFPDATLYNLAVGGNDTSLEIWCPAPGGYGLLVEMPTIKFDMPAIITNGTGLVTQELAFDAQGKAGVSLLPGRVRSAYFTTATLPALVGLTLIVSADGAGAQTFTFTGAETTMDAVVTKIMATATGFVASVDRQAGDTGGVLRLESSTKGLLSSINVTAPSTADVLLGIDNAVHTGLDGKSILVTLYSPLAA